MLPDEVLLVLDPDTELQEYYASRIPTHVKIVISKEKGLSHARNAGIRKSLGDVIAFIDDDARADKDWLRNLVKNYNDPVVLGVGGLIKPVWENGRPRWFPEELDWVVGCSYKGLPEHKSCVRNPIGCNMSFRKMIFEKIGYFKSNIGRQGKKLIGSEEAELSARLLGKIPNTKIIHDPSAIVYHKVPKSRARFTYFMRRSYYEGVSKRLMKKMLDSNPSDVLSVEKTYANYLLKVSIPLRLKQIYKLTNVFQLFTLLLSMTLVLIGYLV